MHGSNPIRRQIYVIGILSFAYLAPSALASSKGPSLQISGPIQGTPFNADSLARKPTNLAALQYAEREYFISGHSNVYDWSPNGNFAVRVLRSQDYTTRIIVRQPADARRWRATAVVEIVNMTGFGPALGMDYEGVWVNNWREITRQGMAYVGITSKPNVFESLVRFDADRYASLSMPNPLRPEEQICGTVPGSPNYNPNLSKAYETGLIFDALAQLGALLHSDSASNPLGAPAKFVYLTGLSQSAAYAKTYLRFIAPRVTLRSGAPIYNGYRFEGAVTDAAVTAEYGVLGALNQCAVPLPPNDPQLTIPDPGVPVIELHSSADLLLDLPRQPDRTWYRLWEAAGAFHDNAWTFTYGFPNARVFNLVMPGIPQAGCDAEFPQDPPYQDVYDSSLRALDEWVRLGRPAPHAARVELANDQQALDLNGNPAGGLRLPAIEAPVAVYHTEMFEPKPDCSHRTPLDHAQLKRLYADHEKYVAAVSDSLRQLLQERLLTPEDAQQELIDATRAPLP